MTSPVAPAMDGPEAASQADATPISAPHVSKWICDLRVILDGAASPPANWLDGRNTS